MDFWIKAGQLLLSLSLLIVLHEFGHFIPARIFKTRVEKFYLFFDWKFSLLKKKIGETEWGIGWIPLGGYVKIAGMIDESMDKEQMAKPAQPWEFRSKPAWQRLIIMIGGVVVNVIVGMLIYIFVVFTWGQEQVKTTDLQHGLYVHEYMNQFGIHSGDNVLKIDGQEVNHINDINNGLLLRGVRTLTVEHPNGKVEDISLPDDIDYKLFEEGAFPAFNLRTSATSINNFRITRSNDAINLKKNDIILHFNDETITQKSLANATTQDSVSVDLLRGSDSIRIFLQNDEIDNLVSASYALKAGLETGDQITAINQDDIKYFDQIVSTLHNNKKEKVDVTVLRGDSSITLNAQVTFEGSIGFVPNYRNYEDSAAIHTMYYGFGESISKGIGMGVQTLSDYSSQLKFLFTTKGAGSMGGFGSLGGLFSPTWDWEVFWSRTALISIILAFMNILPIPALDGGHVIFLLYEIITGKEAPQKVLEYAQIAGFILILSLVLYANGNDIFKYFFGG